MERRCVEWSIFRWCFGRTYSLRRNFMSRRLIVVLFLALALATMLVPAAFAADPTTKQIGLVVAFPDGTEHLEIVTVPTTATTFDVLQKAKITLASVDTGFGPGVCGINNFGCPATNCFCDAAHYWAYYRPGCRDRQMGCFSHGRGQRRSHQRRGRRLRLERLRSKATTRPSSRRFTPSLRSSPKLHRRPCPCPNPGRFCCWAAVLRA